MLHFLIIDEGDVISVSEMSLRVADGGAEASGPISPSRAVKGSLIPEFMWVDIVVGVGVVVYICDGLLSDEGD